MWWRIQLPITESATSQLNLALDIALRVSVSRKQTEFSAQVRDNVSNALLACVHLPVCANLATCILDVKDGYCGICYQFLIPAALKKSSEDFTEFCKHQEEDFERVDTVYVYTTPHRMPEAELIPEAPADPIASQELNSTFAPEDAISLEEAVSESTVFHPELAVSASDCSQIQTQLESHVLEQSQGVPAVSDTLQEGSAISFQPQALSVASDNPPSLADAADNPSPAKFTFKNVPRQPTLAKPAAPFASQKAQVHHASQSRSPRVRSVPSHPKAAPTSSRLVPSTAKAAPTTARSAPKPEPVPADGQAPEPLVPASAPIVTPAPRATPTVKAFTPSPKAEPVPQKAAASSGKASAAPDKARSKKGGPSAEKAAVKPAAKLKPTASIPDTLPRPTSPVLGLKTHNRVNSQSGTAVLKNKKGPQVAFEAFSVLDGFGCPSAPLQASKTLVPTILAALDGSKPIAWARKGASDGQLGFALQVAFMEALPKALLEGYSVADADLRDQVKGEGTMATVAFVCGSQLVVATAGTSYAYLDTGAHIYPRTFIFKLHLSLRATLQVAKPDAQSVTTSQSGPEMEPAIMASPPAMTSPPAMVTSPPAMVTSPPAIVISPSAIMTSPPALSKSAKRRIAQQNTARNRATFGCAVLEQEQLLERAPAQKARHERKQQAELQHEEDVKAAEGQHEKTKHAKASASKPEPEAQGDGQGRGEGEAVATKAVNGREGRHPDSTPAPPQNPQAKSSATLHHSQGGHIAPPPSLAPVRNTTVREHDSTPTHRVKAAKAAAARATRPSKVIYVPVHYQRHQSHCHSGAQAGGSQDPRHPLRGHGRARGHMDKRDGHGNGPAATYDAVNTAQGSSQPNQAVSHQQAHTEEARQLPQQLQPQQQQRHSGGNRENRRNERHNEVNQQGDDGHADSFHRQVPTANSQQATDRYMRQQSQRAPACITSDDTGHLSQSQGDSGKPHRGNKQSGQQGQHPPARTMSDDASHWSQLQSGSGVETLASKTNSNQQTSSRHIHDQTQADVGFRPQYGRGGVNRATPGLQQGVNNHWQCSKRVTHKLPPGLQRGTTGQQQGGAGASPELPPGLPGGSAARQHGGRHEVEIAGSAQSSSCFMGIRSDGVQPKAKVGSNPAANRKGSGKCTLHHSSVAPILFACGSLAGTGATYLYPRAQGSEAATGAVLKTHPHSSASLQEGAQGQDQQVEQSGPESRVGWQGGLDGLPSPDLYPRVGSTGYPQSRSRGSTIIGSAAIGPKLSPGLPVGANSSVARQCDNHHELESSRGAQSLSRFDKHQN
ncbi:hypothetical protein WJX82_001000 [Trebouxia sp. C0006]